MKNKIYQILIQFKFFRYIIGGVYFYISDYIKGEEYWVSSDSFYTLIHEINNYYKVIIKTESHD